MKTRMALSRAHTFTKAQQSPLIQPSRTNYIYIELYSLGENQKITITIITSLATTKQMNKDTNTQE